MKRTKGEWKMDTGIDGAIIYIPDIGTIARVKIDLRGWEANAQLIATAPELLAMLKLASGYVRKMVADNVQTALPPSAALDRIQQAINKAESK